ncbi:hypothetical protein [Streptomyces sp. NPDC056479]|uniref:hypothetical protein n=1 Tax=unclassified Streptomyces TaxID=2593676 RepID=UPI00368DFC19
MEATATPIEELRSALVDAARARVHAVRINDEVTALHNLVAAEVHRFPGLARPGGIGARRATIPRSPAP